MVHLALHAGRQAWRDSVTEAVDPARVGVMLGNIVLPTASASAMADWILCRRFERELFRAALGWLGCGRRAVGSGPRISVAGLRHSANGSGVAG